MPKKPKDQPIIPNEHDTAPDDEIVAGGGEAAASDPVAASQQAQKAQSGDAEENGGSDADFAPETDNAGPAQKAGSRQDEDADIESLPVELAESRKRALRLQAELENYRKRTQRVLQEERRYASLALMRDLLPVFDNLQRAIDAARQDEKAAGLLEGVELVADQLANILKQHHCEEIPAAGTHFDPNVHEAIAHLPSDEHDPGQVMEVTQVGYQLHDRVIRPSQVVVAAPRNEDSNVD